MNIEKKHIANIIIKIDDRMRKIKRGKMHWDI